MPPTWTRATRASTRARRTWRVSRTSSEYPEHRPVARAGTATPTRRSRRRSAATRCGRCARSGSNASTRSSGGRDALDRMRRRDGVHREAVRARLLRGHRARCTRPSERPFTAPERADEAAHRRGAGERDRVDLAAAERVARLGRERPRHPRAVGVHPRRRPALRRQRVLEALGRDVRPRAQDPAVPAGERPREPGRGERRPAPGPGSRRDQRRYALGRALADRRDLRADVARRRQPLPQHLHRRAARERDPRRTPRRRAPAAPRVSAAERAGTISIAGATIDRAPSWSSSLTNVGGLVGGPRHQDGATRRAASSRRRPVAGSASRPPRGSARRRRRSGPSRPAAATPSGRLRRPLDPQDLAAVGRRR